MRPEGLGKFKKSPHRVLNPNVKKNELPMYGGKGPIPGD
jgi:hypothetical protein